MSNSLLIVSEKVSLKSLFLMERISVDEMRVCLFRSVVFVVI